jgi:DNA repair protein RecO (recombination protein O)
MAAVSTESIVLQAFSYGETSRILRLLTRDHGVQSVIAKGASRPRSRFGGVLEPFAAGTASFILRENRDLHTLTGFDLTWRPHRLGEQLLRFAGASLLAEIVIKTGIEQTDPDFFDAFQHAVRAVAAVPPAALEPTILAETWALIGRLGFAPALELCIVCGRAVGAEEETTFDYTAGGVRCTLCAVGAAGRPLPPAARSALAALSRGVAVAMPRTAAHWRLLARYLAHHVVESAPLQSLKVLEQSLDPEP